jgi:hypothetical protein
MNSLPEKIAVTLPAAVKAHKTGHHLRLLNRQELAGLQLRLLALAKGLGLTNQPDEHLLAMLTEFLTRNFGDLTEAELTLAVEKWAAGELAPQVQSYGSLSINFLGAILGAWRAFRRQEVLRATQDEKRAQTAQEYAQESTAADPATHHQMVASYMAEKNSLPIIANWEACWQYLTENGQLPLLTKTQQQQVVDQVLAQYSSDAASARLRGREPLPPPKDKAELHLACRRYRARLYYTNLLKELNTPENDNE